MLSLADSEQQFRRLFEAARDGILFVDRDSGAIVDANPYLLGLLGYSRAEVEGRHLWEIGLLGDEGASRAAFRELQALGYVRYDDLPLETRDGRRVEVEFVSNVYRTGDHLIIQCNIREITDRKRAEATNARLAAIVGSSDDAIIAKDLGGVVTSWNAAAARLFGYEEQEAVGESISRIIPADRLDEAAAILERLRGGHRVDHFETVRRRKDGVLVDVSLTISPIRDRAGRLIGASKIARDITDRKRAEAELVRAQDQAEVSGRAKDMFLSALSHELKTPLTPVLATVSRMESMADLADWLRADLATIRRNVELESRLIDDLLEVTRAGRGKPDLHFEVLDAHVVLRSAVELCHVEVDSKQLEVSQAMRAASHLVWGDSSRLQQVFWNLITNAAKFTPPGGIIRIRSMDAGSGRLAIEISDSGDGIDPEFLPRVFNAFEQGNPEASRRQGGLGLGLSIAKLLVDQHGGALTAASDGLGLGSTFRVELEQVAGVEVEQLACVESEYSACVQLETLAGAEASTPSPRSTSRPSELPLRLLLVDDNPDTLRAVGQLLRTMGFALRTASNVAEAMEALSLERFDLLISDIGLPDGSGLEIMHHSRDAFGLKGIAFSGYSSPQDVSDSLAAGFSHHLPKPSSLNQLVDLIRRTAA
ncbi:PAS domain S-box protein [Isosphaeraceae bacterium EP7]